MCDSSAYCRGYQNDPIRHTAHIQYGLGISIVFFGLQRIPLTKLIQLMQAVLLVHTVPHHTDRCGRHIHIGSKMLFGVVLPECVQTPVFAVEIQRHIPMFLTEHGVTVLRCHIAHDSIPHLGRIGTFMRSADNQRPKVRHLAVTKHIEVQRSVIVIMKTNRK